MNFFFAIFLLFVVAQVGEQLPGTEIGDVAPNSTLAKTGFRSGDKITKINGQPVTLWSEVREVIETNAGHAVQFEVARGADHLALTATPELADNDSILSVKRKVGHIEGLSLESLAPVVGVRDPQGPAAAAGVQTLDQIVSINGTEVHFFRELESQLKAALATDKAITIEVRHLSEDDTNPASRTVTLKGPNSFKGSALEALGLESSELYLSKITKDSPAEKAGFLAGDRVMSLNGTPLREWKDVIDVVSSFKAGQSPLHFDVIRNGKVLTLEVAPKLTKLMSARGQEDQRYAIGVYPAYIMTAAAPTLYRVKNPIQALGVGFRRSLEMSQMVIMGLVRLVQNQVSARNIGGVISIGRFASQSFEMGLVAFLKMMALISVNLFLLNLLPVPILDGGHLVFFTIEAIKGAPLGLRKMELAQQVGLIFLISLMVFAMFNDISNLIRPPW
jgi:regulator of sigma E protease